MIQNNFKNNILLFLSLSKSIDILKEEINKLEDFLLNIDKYLCVCHSLDLGINKKPLEKERKTKKDILRKTRLIKEKERLLKENKSVCPFLVKNFRYVIYKLCLDENISFNDLCVKLNIVDKKEIEDFCFSDVSLKKSTYISILNYFSLSDYYMFWISDCFELKVEIGMQNKTLMLAAIG